MTCDVSADFGATLQRPARARRLARLEASGSWPVAGAEDDGAVRAKLTDFDFPALRRARSGAVVEGCALTCDATVEGTLYGVVPVQYAVQPVQYAAQPVQYAQPVASSSVPVGQPITSDAPPPKFDPNTGERIS